eukprot:TRINITY_DN43456_c0_g1_i1.p1 TRINITY_DN43456_c0_g1~~TRINITY_DN43456_c0_g1_i1.p1  ORF type:complete len:294 (-),score=25.13 TRINITY_DN43456_c0_g1_i1:14-826(-)
MEGDDDSGVSDYQSHDEEEEEIPWITWFCALKGNEFFCEIDEEYLQDDFNLTGLNCMVPFYENALDMILDLESPGEADLTPEQQGMVESAAETLYGLIHARFILTGRGLKLMEDKYKVAAFGRCPRVMCSGHAALPVGQSDIPREANVKIYCSKCNDIYYPRSSRHKNLDGAFWGTTFPHLFLMTFPDHIVPKAKFTYTPKIYGFRVHSSSVLYQRGEEVSKDGKTVPLPGTTAAQGPLLVINPRLASPTAGATQPNFSSAGQPLAVVSE